MNRFMNPNLLGQPAQSFQQVSPLQALLGGGAEMMQQAMPQQQQAMNPRQNRMAGLRDVLPDIMIGLGAGLASGNPGVTAQIYQQQLADGRERKQRDASKNATLQWMRGQAAKNPMMAELIGLVEAGALTPADAFKMAQQRPEKPTPYSDAAKVEADYRSGLISREMRDMRLQALSQPEQRDRKSYTDAWGIVRFADTGEPLPGQGGAAPQDGEPRSWVGQNGTVMSPKALELQRKQEEEARAKQSASDMATTASDIITTTAARAREAAGNRAFGGFGQGIVSMNPYSDAAEVQRQAQTLKDIAKVESLMAMRRASPTGAAVGALTEKEAEMLANRIGTLDPASPNFLRDLDDYERALLRFVHGREEGDRIYNEARQGQLRSPRSGGGGGWTIEEER